MVLNGWNNRNLDMTSTLLNLNKNGFSSDFSWLPAMEKIVKQKFGLKKQISIALVDDRTIRELNRVYRKKDKITDVLSFEIKDKYILGEVLICLAQARRQAEDKKNTYKSELQLLTIHGILHLLGYDHEKSKAAALKQESAEQVVLNNLQ